MLCNDLTVKTIAMESSDRGNSKSHLVVVYVLILEWNFPLLRSQFVSVLTHLFFFVFVCRLLILICVDGLEIPQEPKACNARHYSGPFGCQEEICSCVLSDKGKVHMVVCVLCSCFEPIHPWCCQIGRCKEIMQGKCR